MSATCVQEMERKIAHTVKPCATRLAFHFKGLRIHAKGKYLEKSRQALRKITLSTWRDFSKHLD